MLALAGQPSLHGYRCMYGLLDSGGTSDKLQAKNKIRPLFPLIWVFLLSRNSLGYVFGVLIVLASLGWAGKDTLGRPHLVGHFWS